MPKELLVFFNQYLPIEDKRLKLCVLRVSRERSERVVKKRNSLIYSHSKA